MNLRKATTSLLTALALLMAFSGAAPVRAAGSVAPDYTRAVGAGHLLHWAHMPLRVYFVPRRAATDAHIRATLAGFGLWARATNGFVATQVVDSPAKADLTVQFEDTPTVSGQAGAAGYTEVSFYHTTLHRARMTLAAGGVAPDDLKITAAHEFGHALGIDGHSDDPDDLMYPVTTRWVSAEGVLLPPQQGITARDLNTLRVCYTPVLGNAR